MAFKLYFLISAAVNSPQGSEKPSYCMKTEHMHMHAYIRKPEDWVSGSVFSW